ncbi:MAG: Box C/D snoRNA protein 1 [Vezdaea aestivalis]|nr:MAG: Box C/D snoRNA protein 1 [Vezdaea aestivalis]
MGDPLLTDLCSVCRCDLPKYRCPRCSARTCSLACVKRHKLRARCSGVRNAAVYRKRHELKDPANFDQDFNFITKIERARERNLRECGERGIPDLPPRRAGTHPRVHSNELVVERLKRDDITVIKAPAGFSRSKENITHWNGQFGKIVWTVEWLHTSGKRHLKAISDGQTIHTAYDRAATPSGTSHASKRTRNRKGRQPTSDNKITPVHLKHPAEGDGKKPLQLAFYLHDPTHRSEKETLHLLNPDATLSDSLKGRTLVEYPTIYVFDKTQPLPSTFTILTSAPSAELKTSINNPAEQGIQPESTASGSTEQIEDSNPSAYMSNISTDIFKTQPLEPIPT